MLHFAAKEGKGGSHPNHDAREFAPVAVHPLLLFGAAQTNEDDLCARLPDALEIGGFFGWGEGAEGGGMAPGYGQGGELLLEVGFEFGQGAVGTAIEVDGDAQLGSAIAPG